jgi:hypothetical protein
MAGTFDTLSETAREKLRRRKQPHWTASMLATPLRRQGGNRL